MNSNWVKKLMREIDEEDDRSIFLRAYENTVDYVEVMYYKYIGRYTAQVRHWYRNFKFFLPHIIKMRDWDSSYQIDLFADSLEHLARGLKRHNSLVNSRKYYRRCMRAAAQLRRAYNFEAYNDKSYVQLLGNNPVKFVNCGHYSQMTHEYSSKGQEYYEKMSKLIMNRLKNEEKEAKREAWEYIAKHIEYFWD